MFLEQICPGQANSHSQAIHTFVYKNERFIVINLINNLLVGVNLNRFIGLCNGFKSSGLR